MDNQAQTENTTTSVTVAPNTGVNVPEGTKTESQPRPQVDKKTVDDMKADKEKSKATKQIIKK